MASLGVPIRGSVRGRTIVLEADPGLPEGQVVDVVLRPRPLTKDEAREALRRAAGGWAEDGEELDRYLEWNRQQRKVNRPEIEG